jgi:hypothetical protein
VGPKVTPQQPYRRGEVVAALLILLARDKAIQDRKAPQSDSTQLPAMSLDDFKHDGDSRIVTVLEFVDALVPTGSRPFVRGCKPSHYSKGHSSSTVLEKAFGDSFIYFNHFIKVYDFKMINRKYLWRLICHGAAIVCASNQMGIDILVPVLTGTILQPEFVSAILFQVKNNARYTNNVSPTSAILFTMMDPFKVGLFSKRDMENPLPPPSHCHSMEITIYQLRILVEYCDLMTSISTVSQGFLFCCIFKISQPVS